MAIALDNLRVGRFYEFTNQGEKRRLEIIARLSSDNYKVRDVDTTETYTIEELLRWGKGKDYELDEILSIGGRGVVPKQF
ncbi:hypothetical protein [Cecembia lonarensis]|uniref:Uncharacterized protein n=1 Tax=Cecembia lonarensis (strain CCUG 58316 / KCTC 22772 / LW9) TaxID=1225176 RepID=K1LK63_CECL9|nr:hypothetical protein [Cecembia lonarensis]EKB50728.1 hypothetical protein B879_00708 [Cecembia lonarensis LW9]